MLGHGLVRIPKLEIFNQWMQGKFSHSVLRLMLVKPFSYVLPYGEFFGSLFPLAWIVYLGSFDWINIYHAGSDIWLNHDRAMGKCQFLNDI